MLDFDHSLLGMLIAKLLLLAADHAPRRPRGTPWVAANHMLDFDHSWLGVFGAELPLLAFDGAEHSSRDAPSVAALRLATSLTSDRTS